MRIGTYHLLDLPTLAKRSSSLLALWQSPARLAALVAGMLMVTSAVLLLHHLGPQRTLDLKALYGQDAFIYDDRPAGGASIATYIDRPENGFICTLISSDTYKYCGYGFEFAAADADLVSNTRGASSADFSHFNTLHAEIEYEGPAQNIPFTFRTLLPEEAYQFIDQSIDSQTLANYRVAATSLKKSYSIELQRIHMSTQWMSDKKIPGQFAKPDLSKVTKIGIQFPSSYPEGRYKVAIKRFSLSGPWIRTEDLYATIFFFWITFIALVSALQLKQLRQQTLATRARVQELSQARDDILNISKEFEQIAHHDQLTGLLNRQGFEEGAREHLESNPHAEYSIILLDLDHFKSINDTYGHAKGDNILAVVARCIRSQLREADICARWGGEEFLIACPETKDAEAVVVAEKIRTQLAGYRDSEVESLRLTGSFGIAQHEAHDRVATTIDRADQALYEAKNRGRNCYVVAAPHKPAGIDSLKKG